MSKTRDEEKPNRYMICRNGNWSYRRRAPTPLVEAGICPVWIKKSLKTTDEVIARMKRDIYERADDEQCAALLEGENPAAAQHAYRAAVKRADIFGLRFRSWADLVAADRPLTPIERVEVAMAMPADKPAKAAALGLVNKPQDTVKEAMQLYQDEIVASEHIGKSSAQFKMWSKVKWRAANNFIKVVGNKAMADIDRDHARDFHKHWLDRVTGKPGVKRASASAANRDLSNMRVLYEAYFTHIGDPDRTNPFDDLSFKVIKKKRPPFPTEWITDVIMKPGALAKLDEEARGCLLVVVETGARPSEICNLGPDEIRLKHKIPHVMIEPKDDPDDPREIKTASSIRELPLVGVALAVMQKFPNGFPKYKNRELALSANLNSFMKRNKLLPTPKHKPYSLRHSIEDRMKDAHLEYDQRKAIMGHKVDRADYGEGGSLQWKLDGLKKIELPFDPSIV